MIARLAPGHQILAHTADAGLRAQAADLATLFAEAAAALAELGADVDPYAVGLPVERVELEALDLPGLAYAWLNELISLADARRAALRGGVVESLEQVAPPGEAGDEASRSWRLVGRVRLAAFDDRAVRARLGVKSATYHGLRVEPVEGGWALTAYLDI